MKIHLGADHAGFYLKQSLKQRLSELGHEVEDHGTKDAETPCDYPGFAERVANGVVADIAAGGVARGILVCGSAVGMSVAANKVVGARASACHDTYSAHQGVEHDDLNILCLGSRIIGSELAREVVERFVAAEFSQETRYARRLARIQQIEARQLGGAGQ